MTEFRTIRDADLPRIASVKNAVNASAGFALMTTEQELDEEFSFPYVDRMRDVFCAVDDGEVVGYAHTYFVDSTELEVKCFIFGGTHPDHTSRGIGTALTNLAVERAQELLATGTEGLPRRLRAVSISGQDDSEQLLGSLGFTPVRWFSEMSRPLEDLPALVTPEGITIKPWDTSRSAELRDAKNAAFEDHWGSTPTAPEGWIQMTEGWGSRPDVSYMAVDGEDRIVGLLLTHRYPDDDILLGGSYGWIDKIATVRRMRGRGVASALIARALHAYAEQGWTHGAIDVDADNPSGAFGLYGSLGFVPFRGTVIHELPL